MSQASETLRNRYLKMINLSRKSPSPQPSPGGKREQQNVRFIAEPAKLEALKLREGLSVYQYAQG